MKSDSNNTLWWRWSAPHFWSYHFSIWSSFHPIYCAFSTKDRPFLLFWQLISPLVGHLRTRLEILIVLRKIISLPNEEIIKKWPNLMVFAHCLVKLGQSFIKFVLNFMYSIQCFDDHLVTYQNDKWKFPMRSRDTSRWFILLKWENLGKN